jgi:hypothetical protein
MTSGMDKPPDGTLGEDVKAAQIEVYRIDDRPDMMPDNVTCYASYRLATSNRVLFFRAVHEVVQSSGDGDDLEISFHLFQKEGEARYSDQRSDEFSATEVDHIRNLVTNYLRTNRAALHPIYRHGVRIRSVSIRAC